MQLLDWLIVVGYLVWVVVDGVRRAKSTDKLEGYFLADRRLPWWAVGLSVMATQMSAITLVGTTGQGFEDGMRFVQFYFGLPLAMILLSVTIVPYFHRARVYTAYEVLERRFDAKTRALTSFLFLVSRGLSCGVIVAAPAVILSIVLGWNQVLTILAIGLPTTVYTMLGGVQAVTWTDVKQMVVILLGVGAAIVVLITGLPEDTDFLGTLHAAGATGRMQTIDLRFDLEETYTFWSGMIGGLFLMLAYFGCDQSQVQRYLTAKSVDEGRASLMMSAYAKIPLQVVILFIGVLVFVFYLFQAPPMLFNPVHEAAVRSSARAGEYQRLEEEFEAAFERRRAAAAAVGEARRGGAESELEAARAQFVTAQDRLGVVRGEAIELVKDVTGDATYRDVNYVFPTFITTRMPIGLVGLLIAAIFAAAMSSIAAELNSLSTATVMDFYRRHLRPQATERQYLLVSRVVTLLWGLFACFVATFAVSLGSLIEVVNRFGSFFYGLLLGVFVLALGFRRSTARGAFFGLIVGIGAVSWVAFARPEISYLWHNVVGVVVVVVAGLLLSLTDRRPREA
ncbi:MAG TPA: sodium:solute symporter [Thermoanaerobaculia bacterium]|nr:sodium:solute symporter [Thermoanaerobaculia bacterium]